MLRFIKNNIREKFIDVNNTETVLIEVQASEPLVKGMGTRSEEHLILQSTDDNIQEMLEKTADYLYDKNDQRIIK